MSERRKKEEKKAMGIYPSKYRAPVRELMLDGYKYSEIAAKLGTTRGNVNRLTPRVSTFSPEEKKRYLLNKFINKRGLQTTREELEAALQVSIEEPASDRANLLGVKQHHLLRLLRKLPELRLTSRQIVQRQLQRLHKSGEPIHNTGYMQGRRKALWSRASYLFGTYWLALRSIGIKARPIGSGRNSQIKDLTKPLDKTEESVLLTRLAGFSTKRTSEIHGVTTQDCRDLLTRIREKIKQPSDLNRKLRRLEEMDDQLEQQESEVKPPGVEVFERLKLGQPFSQIRVEAGLTAKQVSNHFKALPRGLKLEILKAANARVKRRKTKR